MKFSRTFITWIMSCVCVTSVRFFLHTKGNTHGDFAGGRGLRQGDPLSPLLFVLAMEYLSRIMHSTSKKPGFTYHPHCKSVGLTHLMFADNLLMFCKADISSIQHLKSALFLFSKSADLQANLHKSQIVLRGMFTETPSSVYACSRLTT